MPGWFAFGEQTDHIQIYQTAHFFYQSLLPISTLRKPGASDEGRLVLYLRYLRYLRIDRLCQGERPPPEF